jgi:hypothetical protein
MTCLGPLTFENAKFVVPVQGRRQGDGGAFREQPRPPDYWWATVATKVVEIGSWPTS